MLEHSNQQFVVCKPLATMRAERCLFSPCTSEYLFGETLTATADNGNLLSNAMSGQTHSNWVHVRAERDNYMGYMLRSDLNVLTQMQAAPTHWVTERSTLVFSEPSIKSTVLQRLPFLSKIRANESLQGQFLALDNSGYIFTSHVLPIKQCLKTNAVALAKTHFLGAPYLWGGCSPNGVDCSGLIQALANANGIVLPRDSFDQERSLSNTIDAQHKQTGDLVFWPGHVGILSDQHTLLHATAHSLSCVEEPLLHVEQRAGEVSSIKRLFTD